MNLFIFLWFGDIQKIYQLDLNIGVDLVWKNQDENITENKPYRESGPAPIDTKWMDQTTINKVK